MSNRVVWYEIPIFGHVNKCGLVENANCWTCQNVWFGGICQFYTLRGNPTSPLSAAHPPSQFLLKFESMLRSMFCVHFGWIWVQVLIDASVDFVFISAGFGFRTCSIFAAFWVQSGTILVPFWLHFCSIWGPFWYHFGTIWLLLRGPVEEKFPSKFEDRWAHLALLHFKRFGAQKGATMGS